MAALAFAPPVQAGPVKVKKTLHAVFGWQILKPPPLPSEPIWVDEFSSFLTMELVPIKLFRAEAAISTSEGAEIVPAGTELIGLIGEADGACTTNPQGAVTAGFFVNKIEATNVCLFDTDKDGKVDQYIPWAGRLVGSVPISKNRNTLTPAALKTLDPAPSKATKPLYLQYSYFASFVNKLDFQLCLEKNVGRSATMSGAGYYVGCLGRGYEAKREPLPSRFEALGAQFSVEEKDGKRLKVRQLTPIVPQPVIIF